MIAAANPDFSNLTPDQWIAIGIVSLIGVVLWLSKFLPNVPPK